jgi:hypothetical protein
VIVEPKGGEAASRETLGQVLIRAVYTHRFVAEGIAQNDPERRRWNARGRMIHPHERAILRTKYDRNRSD